MRATLIGVPASHPTAAVELMLDRKGVPFRRFDLLPPTHGAVLRLLGFPGTNAPAMYLDGVRLQGSPTIARALEALQPEPPLFPRDPERRAAVEQAERWGHEVFQPLVRRIVWGTLKRDHSTMGTLLEGGRTGIPVGVAVALAPTAMPISRRVHRASDEAVQADLERLPDLLDRIDAWIGEGLLNESDPTAADFQIAPTIRLLQTVEDVRPHVDERPSGKWARKIRPNFPGKIGPALPPEWLRQLR